MEDDIYSIRKPRIVKIEDDSLYKKYNLSSAKDVPIDDLRPLLKLFFDKAAINMGKESYDAPDVAIESILEFIYKEYYMLPVFYIGMAIIRGSLGKYGTGRLVPNTVYKWFREITIEYERYLKHKEYEKNSSGEIFDLNKYPLGKAICKKIDWLKSGSITEDEWDKINLKELSELIASGHQPTLEYFGIKNK